MYRKKTIEAVVIAILLLVLAATPALAGGWAVLTLDELPQNLQAGQPATIRFMLRQHGVTPLSGIQPTVQMTEVKSGRKLEFRTVELSEPGHYEAVIELPEAGVWHWKVDGFGGHPLPDLNVQPPSVAASLPAPRPPMTGIWLAAGVLTLLLAAGLLTNLRSRGAVKPLAWGILLFPLLAAGLLVYNTKAGTLEAPVVSPSDTGSEYAYGEALFVAKGCVTCHTNQRIESRYVELNVAIGPDLTAHQTTPEFLRLWLKNPTAIKSGTTMPTLGLSDQEIEALIAFVIPKE